MRLTAGHTAWNAGEWLRMSMGRSSMIEMLIFLGLLLLCTSVAAFLVYVLPNIR